VLDAYKDAYNLFKKKVHDAIGADGADLNRRVSNLMAAKNSFKELNLKSKVGKAPDRNKMDSCKDGRWARNRNPSK
jgi:hypothetical protein